MAAFASNLYESSTHTPKYTSLVLRHCPEHRPSVDGSDDCTVGEIQRWAYLQTHKDAIPIRGDRHNVLKIYSNSPASQCVLVEQIADRSTADPASTRITTPS